MRKLVMLLAYFVMMCSTAYGQWTEKESFYKTSKSLYKQLIKEGYKVYGDETIEELVSKDISRVESGKYCYSYKTPLHKGGEPPLMSVKNRFVEIVHVRLQAR